jgi:hypothetical protein
LQQQPVVNQDKVQKAKNDFQQKYLEYQKSHSSDKDFKDPWQNYMLQWWWNPSSSPTKSGSSSGTLQSSGSHSDDGSSSRHR